MSTGAVPSTGRRGLAALLAALLALAFVLLALPAAAGAAGGGISGTVTLAAGGAPVSGARVCARLDVSVPGSTCAYTQIDGTYEIEGLSSSQYFVEFVAGESGMYLIRQLFSGADHAREATKVPVTIGATTTGIDAAMVEGGVIAGTVTAEAGGPIERIQACVKNEPSRNVTRCTSTKADGAYKFVGLPPGFYEAIFSDEEGEFGTQAFPGVPVSVSVMTTRDAVLSQGAVITGRVYAAADHAPLGEILVCAIAAASGELEECAESDSSGGYSIAPLAPGVYKVGFSVELREFFPGEPLEDDGWPTQYWNLKSSFAEAEAINLAPLGFVTGIDGLLGSGQSSGGSDTPGVSSPVPPPPGPVTSAPTPTPATSLTPLRCGKGKVKKRVKGKARCVKRHKHHRGHTHHQRHGGSR